MYFEINTGFIYLDFFLTFKIFKKIGKCGLHMYTHFKIFLPIFLSLFKPLKRYLLVMQYSSFK